MQEVFPIVMQSISLAETKGSKEVLSNEHVLVNCQNKKEGQPNVDIGADPLSLPSPLKMLEKSVSSLFSPC